MQRFSSFLSLALALFFLSSMAAPARADETVAPIDYCLSQNILRLDTDGAVEPEAILSKIQFIVMLSRAYGLFDDGGQPFYLVKEGHFDAAAKAALIDPAAYPAEVWARPISRYEAAAICRQALILSGGGTDDSASIYADISADRAGIPAEYLPSVNAVYSQGIMNGVDAERTFSGWSTVTVAQGAAMIHRLKDPSVRVLFPLPRDFGQLLGFSATSYGGVSHGRYRDNRIANLLKASRVLDGYVLEPGAEFSFNDILGNPGKAEGYLIAPIIDNAKSAMGYGGGVCQVSTMVFNAALKSNLPILERHSHSLHSAYIGPGLDSTIYHPTLNLRFRNDYSFPLKLVFTHDAATETVTMGFYGSIYLAIPRVDLSVKQSNGVYTLTRLADGVANYTVNSKYKN